MKEPRYQDIREARAFERKLNPTTFNGGDELHPPAVGRPTRPTEADRKALEAEEWYQDWLKIKAAR
jgi:hypothetical protein